MKKITLWLLAICCFLVSHQGFSKHTLLTITRSHNLTKDNGVAPGLNDTDVCDEPTELSATNITQTTADLEWIAGNTETSWNVEYGATGFVQGEGTTVTGISTNLYSVDGLVADSDYEFYVQANCDVDINSSWLGPYALHTLCNSVSAPLTESFANTTTPLCWFTTSLTSTWKFSTGASYAAQYAQDHTTGGGTNYAWVDGSNIDLEGSVSLTTVPIDVSGLSNPSLSFALFSNNTSSEASNDIDVEVFDGVSWNNVYNTTELLGDQWQEYTIDLSGLTITSDIMVRFTVSADSDAAPSSYHNDVLFDDIVVNELPSCLEPNNVVISNVLANSAELSWVDQDSNPNNWNIELIAAGTSPTGVVTHSATTNPFTLDGLTGNTAYEVYIQTSCVNGDSSAWVGPFSMNTPCESMDLPVCTDFTGVPNGNAATLTNEDCWNFLDGGNGYGYVTNGQFYIFNGADINNDYALVSPQINNLGSGDNQITFDVKAVTSSTGVSAKDIIVGTLSAPEIGASFTPITTVTVTEAYPTPENFTVTIPSGTDQFLALKHGLGAGYVKFYFDNICIEPIPSCLEVEDITYSSLTNSSVNLSWMAGADETSWNIEYGPVGFTQGTGTVVTADSNPYVLTDLNGNTEYDVYVQANCGAGDLAYWAEGASFTTFCDPLDLPLCEEFDEAPSGNSSVPTIEECWTFIDSGSGYGYVDYTEAFYLKNHNDSTGDYILVSPEINALSSGSNRVRFFAKGPQDTDLIVGTLSYPTDGSTFTAIETITLSSSEYESFIVDIPVGTDTYVGIKHGQSAVNLTYRIDSVCIEEIPSCLEVSDIVVNPISDNSATMQWTVNGNETEWIVEYGEAGFEQGTGDLVYTSTSPFTLDNLIGGTQYEFYVQANCGAGDLAAWTGPILFTTDCGAFTPEYLEDFENISTLNETCWTEGSASTIAEGPNGTDSAWMIDSFNNDGNGGSARIRLNSNTKMDWLVSPVFDLSAGGYGLRFDAGVTAHDSSAPGYMGSDDQVQVLISEDNGATWTNLLTWVSGDHPFNAGYEVLVDLSSYTSATSRIAIWANEGTSDDTEDYDFFVDNFEVTTWDTLGVEENKIAGLAFYPNPVKSELTLKSQKDIQNIAVYNVLGQQVIEVNPNTINATLDMGNLQEGAYFVKVTINGAVETFRIIKQ
ncbi:fibronectin type III domain-containing protein [Mangrovimonas aestuarii]|uniref:fibronectin type III domain-containing protein n=1 Tax=Mangrovimonas aestuarii TaxID=3018443 RepID=UPI0023790558|nr:fibronectin type III domain-containing protein [Mangrovimonas aestuarii]